MESVTERILERYQDGWAVGMEQPRQFSHRMHHLHKGPSSYYNLPPTPDGFSASPPPTHPRQQLDRHRIALPNQARSMTYSSSQIRSLNPCCPPNVQTSQSSQSPNPQIPNHAMRYFPPNTSPPCGFCRGNAECAEVYSSHQLRSPDGKVTCPYLRGHVCETCGATDDHAHTRSYCPLTPGARALPTLLKATARQSDGRLRRRTRRGGN